MSDNLHEEIVPVEDKKAFIKEYWNDRAEGFADLRRKEFHSPKYQEWRQELIQHIEPVRHEDGRPLRVLDIGCGPGFFSIILSQEGCTCHGIDMSPEMVKVAQELALEELDSTTDDSHHPQFSIMDCEHMTFPDESFDIVVARNVMWNLPHPEEAYKEWLRVLKPGGMLLNFDAEHAKGHHKMSQHQQHAHLGISNDLNERCHVMYHMLDISSSDRPRWDQSTLEKLGIGLCQVDTTVGDRIYKNEDIFYITAPMFSVKALK